MIQFPNQYADRKFMITVNTPCNPTILNMPAPDPVIADMNTSVLLEALQLPAYGVFTDTVSLEFGNGTNVCG